MSKTIQMNHYVNNRQALFLLLLNWVLVLGVIVQRV